MMKPIDPKVKAEEFARSAHKGQFRKYGDKEPYFNHPLRVATRVAELLPNSEVAYCAALLHDVVEDCGVSFNTLHKEFGTGITYLVWELTNPSKRFPELRRAERKEMDREHIRQATAVAQLLKACDRIDNLRSMEQAPEDFKGLYAHESILLAEVLTKIPNELFDELVNEAEKLLPGCQVIN